MCDYSPVSVVIPCWRSANTIARAVASVAAQTSCPAEVIVVDDASGDNTVAKLYELADQYPEGWIKVVELQVNGGPGLARNAGWDVATYPYIAFLDADDAWHYQKIEIQLNWMLNNKSAVLSAHNTIELDSEDKQPVLKNNFDVEMVSLNAMLISNRFPTRAVMLRRELRLRFAGKDVTEDYLLWLQIVASGQQCALIRLPLAFSFRAEFSPGGYSGRLWTHEKRELRCLLWLLKNKIISFPVGFLALTWSLIKYIRRVLKIQFLLAIK